MITNILSESESRRKITHKLRTQDEITRAQTHTSSGTHDAPHTLLLCGPQQTPLSAHTIILLSTPAYTTHHLDAAYIMHDLDALLCATAHTVLARLS